MVQVTRIAQILNRGEWWARKVRGRRADRRPRRQSRTPPQIRSECPEGRHPHLSDSWSPLGFRCEDHRDRSRCPAAFV